jgi:prepilin-type N-terminal cleavage/methylation domain-containing protein
MRQPKNEERSAWKLSRLCAKSNQKGFSLLEMMISVAIGLMVSAGIASVFVFSMQQLNLLIEKNETEQAVLQTAFYLQRYLSQASNIQAVREVTPLSPVATPASPGFVDVVAGEGQLDYDFDTGALNDGGPGYKYKSGVGTYYNFAVFNREAGDPNGAVGSKLYPTGIFIRDPDLTDPTEADPSKRSYTIEFNAPVLTPPFAGVISLTPDHSGNFFSRIHRIQVQKLPVAGGTGCTYMLNPLTDPPGYATTDGLAIEVVVQSTDPTPAIQGVRNGLLMTCLPKVGSAGWPRAYEKYWVKTVTYVITGRYFKTIDRSGWDYFWDNPTENGAAPANIGSYRDISQTVKINFRNNTLTTQSLTGGAGVEQRVNGTLYFYNSYVPMANTIF